MFSIAHYCRFIIQNLSDPIDARLRDLFSHCFLFFLFIPLGSRLCYQGNSVNTERTLCATFNETSMVDDSYGWFSWFFYYLSRVYVLFSDQCHFLLTMCLCFFVASGKKSAQICRHLVKKKKKRTLYSTLYARVKGMKPSNLKYQNSTALTIKSNTCCNCGREQTWDETKP